MPHHVPVIPLLLVPLLPQALLVHCQQQALQHQQQGATASLSRMPPLGQAHPSLQGQLLLL
jgi:hypothetical protein